MNFNEVPFVDKHYIVNFLGKFIGVFKFWGKFFWGMGFGGGLGVEFFGEFGNFCFFRVGLGVLVCGEFVILSLLQKGEKSILSY